MNRKWLWRTAILLVAIIGSLLGSYVHAHASTSRHVVYAFKGTQGYTDPVRKPGSFAVEQGAIRGRNGHWSQWDGTARTSSIKINDNGGGWKKGSVRLWNIKRHNGHPYYSEGQVTEVITTSKGTSKLIYCIRFTKNAGSKVPEWNPAPGNAELDCVGS
jgi:hypothetical protein